MTVRDWVSPVDWNTADFDWNGNPQGIVVTPGRPFSAVVTKLPAEMTATLSLVPGMSAKVTKLGAMTAKVERVLDATAVIPPPPPPPGPPVITSVFPASGAPAGGTLVTLSGVGFTGATDVVFGVAHASSLTVLSDTTATVLSPAHASGAVHLQLTTPAGTSAATSADLFTYATVSPPPLPTITGLSPAAGGLLAGHMVTILGTHFDGLISVSFGGVDAPATLVSSTQISAAAPAHAAGTVDVTVTTSAGTSTVVPAGAYLYLAPFGLPRITSVFPSSGALTGGELVTLIGTGFTGAKRVVFGSAVASALTVVDDTTVTVRTPIGVAGVVDVRITTPNGTSAPASTDQFTYSSPPPPPTPPSISGVSPAAGGLLGGGVVTISGANFDGLISVSIGGVNAPASLVDSTTITATVPAHAAGIVDVRVVTSAGTSAVVTGDHYTYVAPPAPTVSGITPSTGPIGGGTLVTISGTHLTGATGVRFGTSAAVFDVVDDSTIHAIAPAHAFGIVEIVVSGPGGDSGSTTPFTFDDVFNDIFGASSAIPAIQFTYFVPTVPVVSSVIPSSGGPTAGGNNVIVNGSGLTGVTAVTFGGVPALSITPVTDSGLVAVAPPHAAGTVDIRVTTPFGTSAVVSADHYVYVAPPVPTISSVSPGSGSTAGGNSVTISGAHLAGATAVKFGSTDAASFFVVSDTQITATAPPRAAGTCDVHVTTAAGTSAPVTADHYTFVTPTPAVTSVTPASGDPAGGNSVGIRGSGLTGATAVHVGGVAATSVVVWDDGLVSAAIPAGTGTQHITVTTPGGTSAASVSDLYVYVAVTTFLIVPSSIDHTGATDVYAQLRDWFAANVVSGPTPLAPTYVKFQPSAIYKDETGLILDTLQNVVIDQNGGELRATIAAPYTTTGAGHYSTPYATQFNFKRRQWTVINCDNIRIWNGTARGASPSATGRYVAAYAGQANIFVQSSHHVVIDHMTLVRPYGDFVEFINDGSASSASRSTFGHVHHCTMNGASRQGVTFAGCEDIVIETNDIRNVARHCFDGEADQPDGKAAIKRVTIQNNTITASIGLGFVNFGASGSSFDISDIFIDGNVGVGVDLDCWIGNPQFDGTTNPVWMQNFTFTNNRWDTPGNCPDTDNKGGAVPTYKLISIGLWQNINISNNVGPVRGGDSAFAVIRSCKGPVVGQGTNTITGSTRELVVSNPIA